MTQITEQCLRGLLFKEHIIETNVYASYAGMTAFL